MAEDERIKALKQRVANGTWVTKTGIPVNIEYMATHHIRNSIDLLRKWDEKEEKTLWLERLNEELNRRETEPPMKNKEAKNTLDWAMEYGLLSITGGLFAQDEIAQCKQALRMARCSLGDRRWIVTQALKILDEAMQENVRSDGVLKSKAAKKILLQAKEKIKKLENEEE